MRRHLEVKHLCRYITPPPIANEPLALNRAGRVLTLKTPYREGTTHIVMSPLEFTTTRRVVPRPRLDLIVFHGGSHLMPGCALAPTTQRFRVFLNNRYEFVPLVKKIRQPL